MTYLRSHSDFNRCLLSVGRGTAHSVDSADMAGATWTRGGPPGIPFAGVGREKETYLSAKPASGSSGSHNPPPPTPHTPESLHALHPHTSLPRAPPRPPKSLRSHRKSQLCSCSPEEMSQAGGAEEGNVRKEGNGSWSFTGGSEVTLSKSILLLGSQLPHLPTKVQVPT